MRVPVSTDDLPLSPRVESPFEDTRVSDNLIAEQKLLPSSLLQRRELQARINLHRTRRTLLRARSNTFSIERPPREGTKNSCFSFSRRRRLGVPVTARTKGENVAPLIRSAKDFSGRGRRGFVSRLRNRRAVYAKFSFRRGRPFSICHPLYADAISLYQVLSRKSKSFRLRKWFMVYANKDKKN